MKFRRKSLLEEYKFKITPELEGVPKCRKDKLPRRFLATPDTLVELCVSVVDKLNFPKASDLKSTEITQWIDKLGFPEYRNAFFVNSITGKNLLSIDVNALRAMNISKFEDAAKIAKSVREMFKVEPIIFDRCISLPPRHPWTHYLQYKLKTGFKYETARPSELWRRMHIIREAPQNFNHWEILIEWLKHNPSYQKERIGKLKALKQKRSAENPFELCCGCLGVCQCGWSESKPYLQRKMSYIRNLVPVEPDDEFILRNFLFKNKRSDSAKSNTKPTRSSTKEDKENDSLEFAKKWDRKWYEGRIKEIRKIYRTKRCNCLTNCECARKDVEANLASSLNVSKIDYPCSDAYSNESV